MYIGDDIRQLLQSCIEESAPPAHIMYPQFPLSEFFYVIMSKGIELRDRFSSLEHLPQLMEQYRNEHPDCTLTAEDLLREGWLTPFMDRWDFNVVPDEADPKSDALEPDIREHTAVLRWLWVRGKGADGIFVPQFGEILEQFRQNFPQMPDEDWFARSGYLSENRQYLSHGHYCGELAEALAFLLMRKVNRNDAEQLDWWLNLASALGMLHSAFELIPLDYQKILLERILSRLEAGTYPDLQSENTRIALFLGWQQNQLAAYAENNTFITGDLVADLHTFDQFYWEWTYRLYWRQRVLINYLSTLCGCLSVLETPLFTRAVRMIRRLAGIGCLEEAHIPAEALLRLWESPETSLIACDRMMASFMQQIALPDDCFCTVLQKIVEQEVLSRYQSPECGAEYLSLLRYFAHQPPGGLRGERAAKALAQLLTPLKRERHMLEPLLASLTEGLARYLEQENNYLDWGRDFRLACLLMQKVYYHGDVPAAGSALSFQTLRKTLCAQYVRIFQPDGILKDSVPNFLDDTCFFHPLWHGVYREGSGSLQERCRFLLPDLLPPEGKESQLVHYHKCVIHLTVLTVLMQNRQEPDTFLEEAFVQALVQVLRPKNNLLNYDRIAIMKAQPVFEAAIAQVKSSEACYGPFIQELESYKLPELVLICHGAEDDHLRAHCCEIIETRENEQDDALRVFSYEQLVQTILDEKVESLYAMVRRILEHRLEYWRNQKSYMAPQQQEWTESQLNRVWYQEEAYDKILEHGLPFYQALVWMKSAEHQDLDKAERTWELLLEKSVYSGYAINLMYTYILQYQAAQSKNDGPAACRKLMEKAVLLRERVESDAYPAWSEEDQQAYAQVLYAFYREAGTEREKVIQTLRQELNFRPDLIEKLEEAEKKEPEGKENDPITIELKNPVSALQQYLSAPLETKSEWFFQLKSCPRPEIPQNALLLWCIMNTLNHLSAYGPQLLIEGRLDEDRCSQLFRELFNHGYPEMYGLSANDQEKTGHTGHEKKDGSAGIGEVDMMIKYNGQRVGIVEALVLNGMDRSYIRDHIYQLLGYNIQHVPLFLFVYGNVKDPEKLWHSYSEYIKNIFAPEFQDENLGSCEVQKFLCSDDYIPCLHDGFCFNRHMLRMTFKNNGKEFPPMYHIFLNVGSLENLPSAVEARKNRQAQ